MPNIKIIESAIAELPKGPPLVAALPGGTTGIGSYIAKALAKTFAKDGSKLRVYIVGRNATRAESVISECQKISPGSEWRFIKASDLALISEVDRASAEIIRQETQAPFHGGLPKLGLLYMSHATSPIGPRRTTPEGLDAFISTLYYSRIRFILQLIPLLTAGPTPGHVISVYAGTFEDGTKPGEFPVGTPSDDIYGMGSVRKNACFMKCFAFEELAKQNAGKLSLTHIFPGLVDGPGFYNADNPTWFKILWRVLKPLMGFYMTSPDVCGQVMVYLGTSNFPAQGSSKTGANVTKSSQGDVGGGSYSVGQRGDAQKGIMYEKVRTTDSRQKIWNHTLETIDRAAKAGAAT